MDDLMEKMTNWNEGVADLPERAVMLTSENDVAKDRIEVECVGWGKTRLLPNMLGLFGLNGLGVNYSKPAPRVAKRATATATKRADRARLKDRSAVKAARKMGASNRRKAK